MSARTALVLSSDPYLAFLLERHPEGLEVTVGDDQMRVAAIVDAQADVVICEHDDPRRHDLQDSLGHRLITVAAADDRGAGGPRVIQRPLTAEAVMRAIEDVDRETPKALDDPIGALDRAYPGLVAAAGVFAAGWYAIRGDGWLATVPALVVIAYGMARIVARQRWVWLVDVGLAAGFALAFDGSRGPFVLLTLVVAAGLGLRRPAVVALPLSLGIGLANVAGTWLARTSQPLDVGVAVQSLLLVTLVAALAVLGASYVRSWEHRDADRLGEVLHELRILARSEPNALQLWTVAQRGVRAICDAAGAERGVLLLVDEDGELEVVAAQGVDVPGGTRVRLETELAREDLSIVASQHLPDELTGVAADRTACTIVRLTWRGGGRGWAIVAGATPRGRRGDVLRVAARTATSIANARLFARLYSDTADEQRRRIAGELHDSTAQILTHLKLELELLARSGGAEARDLERLARVTDRAQQGVREVIHGLRASVHDDGLAGALRSYIADLQSRGGVSLLFRATTRQHLAPEADHEVFRIAQEAISNAYQHAGAELIEVTLEPFRDGLRLAVADDGSGLPRGAEGSDGLGLAQMRARAERIGAELHVRSSDRGTRVVLYVPYVSRSAPPIDAGESAHRV